MPIYCYRGEMDQVVEKFFKMGEAPESLVEDGQHFKRDFAAERKGFPPTKGWPIESVATGVHANDAQKLRDHFKKSGVPTHVTEDGNPVYRDENHKRRGLKSRGFIDKQSFVG